MTQDVAPPLCNKRYRLVGELGSGGAATVFRAYDALLGVWRAVKVLSPRMAGKAKVRERFLNEARTMARLKHPHIVTVYDVGIDGERVYMVMETLEGGCVMDRVKGDGPLPPRMASAVIQALLSGLGEAHLHGVVHRDVKPHNVLISKEGVPKLIDFGIAQHADRSLTKTGAVIGTWAYMAPEQRTNAKAVDPRSDLYSTGATFYAILTGKDPFDLYATDLHSKLFAGLPEPLVGVMKTATCYESDDRYSSAAEMFHALQAAHRLLPPDPVDTPALAMISEVDLNLPVVTDFEDFEEATGQSRVPASERTTRENPRPPGPDSRVVDGVSLHDTGQDDFAFFDAAPSQDFMVEEPPDFDSGGNLGRIALGILLVAIVGTGVGVGAAVFMDGAPLPGAGPAAPEEAPVDSDPAEVPPAKEVPAERKVESGIALEQPANGLPDAELIEEVVLPLPPIKPAVFEGTLVICPGREGDTLTIDGVKVGVIPVRIVLEPGEYEFRVEGHTGGKTKRSSVDGGQEQLDLCG